MFVELAVAVPCGIDSTFMWSPLVLVAVASWVPREGTVVGSCVGAVSPEGTLGDSSPPDSSGGWWADGATVDVTAAFASGVSVPSHGPPGGKVLSGGRSIPLRGPPGAAATVARAAGPRPRLRSSTVTVLASG